MPVTSLSVGATLISLDQVSTVVNGAVGCVSKVSDDGQLSWSYEPGATKPTSGCLALQVSPDNIGWSAVDAISDLSVAAIRQVNMGRSFFVRVAVLSLTIGGGNPFTCRIFV